MPHPKAIRPFPHQGTSCKEDIVLDEKQGVQQGIKRYLAVCPWCAVRWFRKSSDAFFLSVQYDSIESLFLPSSNFLADLLGASTSTHLGEEGRCVDLNHLQHIESSSAFALAWSFRMYPQVSNASTGRAGYVILPPEHKS